MRRKTKRARQNLKKSLKKRTSSEPPKKEDGYGFAEAFWQSLMRSMDAGSVAGDTGWWFRFVMFLVTLGGIFIMGSLIGVLTSGLEGKLEELRKGKSFVCEENHTLILGWSSRIFRVISELSVANSNAIKPRVVILPIKTRLKWRTKFARKIEDTGRTKVVSPLRKSD